MTEQPDENDTVHGRKLHDPGPGKVMPHASAKPGTGTPEDPPDDPGKEMPHPPTA